MIQEVTFAAVTANLTSTSTSYANIAGMATTITPVSGYKVLVMANIGSIGHTAWGSTRVHFKFTGGNIDDFEGDAADGHESHTTICVRQSTDTTWQQHPVTIGPFLDAPATGSAVTYQLQWLTESGTVTLNKAHATDASVGNTSSSIIAMEVKV